MMLSKTCANKLAEKSLLKSETGPIPQALTHENTKQIFPKDMRSQVEMICK